MNRRTALGLLLGTLPLACAGAAARREHRMRVEHASTFHAPFVVAQLRGGAVLACRPLGRRAGVWLGDSPLGYVPAGVVVPDGARLTVDEVARDARGRLVLHIRIESA